MDLTYHINLPNSGTYYDFFYQLSFLVGFILFIYLGWRKKYPMATWLLISVITSVFVILGSKIGTYSFEDWSQFFQTGNLPLTSEKTMIGALFFGWIGVGVAQRVLNFRASIMDNYAWILPVALIIQRLGCLAVGCCFGNPTWSNWGVCYSKNHDIFDYHFQENFVGMAADFTPAVHPIPLYLILGFVGVIFIIKKHKNRFKVNGSLALFVLISLFAIRFFTEFFRDPITNHGQGEILFGIKTIQWIVLGLIIFFSSLLLFREKNNKSRAIEIPNSEESFYRNFWISLLIVLIIALGRNWFTLQELQSIFVRVLLSYFALGFVFFKYFFKKQSVKWSISICLLSLLLMSQTYIDKSDQEEFKPYAINKISIGSINGKSDINYIDREFLGGGCGSGVGTLVRSDTISIGPYYSSFGASYSYKHFHKKNRASGIHASLMKGSYPKEVINLDGIYSSELVQLTAVSLLYQHDRKYFGFAAGGILGSWGTLDQARENRYKSRIAIGFRIGSLNNIHLRLDGFHDEVHPYNTIAAGVKIGIGMGPDFFNWKVKSRFRFSVGNVLGGTNLMLESDLFLTDKIYLSPLLSFGNNSQFGIGIGYEFSKEK